MRLKPFSFRALIYRLAVSVHVLYAKLHGTPGRDCVGQLPGKPGDDLINGPEADVADLGKNLSAKVGTGIDHPLGRKPEQLVGTPRAIPCLLFAVEKKIKSITLAFNSQAGVKSILM